jgi:hypothetical protein
MLNNNNILNAGLQLIGYYMNTLFRKNVHFNSIITLDYLPLPAAIRIYRDVKTLSLCIVLYLLRRSELLKYCPVLFTVRFDIIII